MGEGSSVGPHDFQRLGRIFHRDKCRACLVSRQDHPIVGWAPARFLGDKRPPIRRRAR